MTISYRINHTTNQAMAPVEVAIIGLYGITSYGWPKTAPQAIGALGPTIYHRSPLGGWNTRSALAEDITRYKPLSVPYSTAQWSLPLRTACLHR